VLAYNGDTLSYGNYYWRVNVDTGTGFSDSPVFWHLRVSPAAPGKPSLSTPANNAATNDTTPLLTWLAVSGATTYELQVDNNSSYNSPEYSLNGIASTSQETSVLANGKYYWRVRALNQYQVKGGWSSVRYFTIDAAAPTVPQLLSPMDAAFSTNSKPSFSWKSSGSPTHYEIQLSTSAAFSSTTATYAVTGASFRPPSPLLLTTYYWRVRAFDALNNASDYSSPRRVIITAGNNVAPVPNRYTSSTPTLTWKPFAWAANYQIQVDNNSNFGSREYEDQNISGSAKSIMLPLLPNGTWYWRIRVRLANGPINIWSSWSATQTFTIEAP
jgi:hypothetical protein